MKVIKLNLAGWINAFVSYQEHSPLPAFEIEKVLVQIKAFH
jgi:hypothetical protein